MPPDYSNTVIYRFYCIDPDIDPDYIGHATNFVKRHSLHKCRCNNNKNSSEREYHYKVYKYIRENGGFDNWKFEILEYANLKDKDEAETLERHHIETFKSVLNKLLPALTPEERDEHKKKCSRIWARNNLDKKKGYYNKARKDPEVRKKDVERSKKNREANPDKMAVYLEKIVCDCGAEVCSKGMKRHLTSIKHMEYLKNNPQ